MVSLFAPYHVHTLVGTVSSTLFLSFFLVASELDKQRLAHKLERWGVHPVCIFKDVAKPVSAACV